MKLKDICVDTFVKVEPSGREVACFLYHITEADDLYMLQGETVSSLSWTHIKGIENAMKFWEYVKECDGDTLDIIAE